MKRFTKTIFISLALVSLLSASCENQAAKDLKAQAEKRRAEEKALQLIQKTCFSCHNPDSDIPKRLAPPMYMVRNHYYDSAIARDSFITNIVSWASNPTEENSIMPGALRRFGLMPKQAFNQDDLKIIAGYIYDHDLESDQWYAQWEAYKKANNLDSTSSK